VFFWGGESSFIRQLVNVQSDKDRFVQDAIALISSVCNLFEVLTVALRAKLASRMSRAPVGFCSSEMCSKSLCKSTGVLLQVKARRLASTAVKRRGGRLLST